jgi:uncharacterized repeat protein (TIGR03803 family)
VTEAPSAIFKSTGSALGSVAETTTDLILTALHFDEGPWRYIAGNKIVATVLNDAFQTVFDQLIGGVVDTSIPHVFYYQTNPVLLSAVALEPSPNGFFTFSGLTMTPNSSAGSTTLYFDTSNFRTLDPTGEVTNVSSVVEGNQIPATIHTIVTVSPSQGTVAPGGQLQFQPTVTGVGATLQGVTWSVDGITGGNSTTGLISSTGLYTAPLATGTHSISATSIFDGVTGSAIVTLTGTIPSISISPTATTVPLGAVQTFVANVQGGGSAAWSIKEGAAGGTITQAGIYTAPSQAGNYHVIVTDSANTSLTATSSVTVVTGPTVTAIHPFNHATEGANPWHPPVWGADGYLYGVTEAGGNLSCAYVSSLSGCGTIYKSDASGIVTTLHTFSGTDGAYPAASLVAAAGGTFYGTTEYGGANTSQCNVGGTSTAAGCGSVFSYSASTGLKTLLSFGPFTSPLGVGPQSALIQTNGTLYGETQVGGNTSCTGTLGAGTGSGCGSVFSVSSSNVPSALHTFSGSEGAYPAIGLLLQSDGNFYGTTVGGGTLTCSSYATLGCGTVFKVTPSGSIKTLHSFTKQDGAAPEAALILGSDGKMYGTTLFGGTTTCSGGAQWQGCGTVFKIDTAGSFTLLHSFSGPDGAYPGTLMQASDGYFYGTTESGGDAACAGRYGPGCGTLFRMDSSGNVTVLYAFTGKSDGSWPEFGVIQGTDGNLYGTTVYGGANDDGVVFRVSNLSALTSGAVVAGDLLDVQTTITPVLVSRPHVGPPGPPVSTQP